MEKYGTQDVQAQQRAELEAIRSQLELLRGFALPLVKEAASAEMKRLEGRASELAEALGRAGGGDGARE